VNFHPTQRNAPARQTLERLGFRPDGDGEGLLLDVTARPLICDFIETVIRRAPEAIDSCL
jgi:RimJ/RimL family protein N-acetyltransferase